MSRWKAMFFVLAKILGFFALPSNIVIIARPARRRADGDALSRAGRRLAGLSVVLIAIIGLTPIGNALILPLEQRFPPWTEAGRPPDGIVVLGGALDAVVSGARREVALNEAAERMTEVAGLAQPLSRTRASCSRVAPAGSCSRARTSPRWRVGCSDISASRRTASRWKTARATRWRTRASPRRSPIRSRASGGCW